MAVQIINERHTAVSNYRTAISYSIWDGILYLIELKHFVALKW